MITKVVPYGNYIYGNETGTTPRGVVIATHSIFVFQFRIFYFYKRLAEFCNQSSILNRITKMLWVIITTPRGVVPVSFP